MPPHAALGTQRTLSFTLNQDLVKATRDKKAFRFHILQLCSAVSREHRLGLSTESRLQVNCAAQREQKRELYISMATHPCIWHMKPVVRVRAVWISWAQQMFITKTCLFTVLASNRFKLFCEKPSICWLYDLQCFGTLRESPFCDLSLVPLLCILSHKNKAMDKWQDSNIFVSHY